MTIKEARSLIKEKSNHLVGKTATKDQFMDNLSKIVCSIVKEENGIKISTTKNGITVNSSYKIPQTGDKIYQSIVFSVGPVYKKEANGLYILERISLSQLHFSDQMELETCTGYFRNREISNQRESIKRRIEYLEKELLERKEELKKY